MNSSLLRKLSILYLLLPNLLFAWGWFRQPIGALLVTGLTSLFVIELFRVDRDSFKFSRRELYFLIIFSLVFTFFSGAGGLAQQRGDWLAHSAKFYDLYKNPWPIYYPEVERFGAYYYGYFLVPSFLSYLSGQFNPAFIFVWSGIGIFLGFCWVYMLTNRSRWGVFLFLWIRGMGYVLSMALTKAHLFYVPIYRPVLKAFMQHYCYAPNQFISTLLVTAILLYDVFLKKSFHSTTFPLLLLFTWAIMPSISLVIIYACLVFHHYVIRRNYSELDWKTLLVAFLGPAILSIPSLIYFSATNSGTISGWIWSFAPPLRATAYYVVGIALDLVLFFLLLKGLKPKNPLFPTGFLLFLGLLLTVLSAYRIGIHNDWFYRTQIPIFIIVVIYLLREVVSKSRQELLLLVRRQPLVYAVVLVLMVMQFGAYAHLLKDNVLVKTLFPSATRFQPYPYDTFPNEYQLIASYHKASAEQHLGDANSFYAKWLSKPNWNQHKNPEGSAK